MHTEVMTFYNTYTKPASRIIHLTAVDAEVCADCYHVFCVRIGCCEAGSAIDSRSTDRRWATASLESVFDFFDSTIQRRAFDYDWLTTHTDAVLVFCVRIRVVVKRRISNYSETEGLGILSKESSSMFGFGLDDLVVPFGSTACAVGK